MALYKLEPQVNDESCLSMLEPVLSLQQTKSGFKTWGRDLNCSEEAQLIWGGRGGLGRGGLGRGWEQPILGVGFGWVAE